MSDERSRIVAEARTYLGTPFRHRGRTRDGVDCVGLVYLSFNPVVGFPEPPSDYPRQPKTAMAFRRAREFCDRIPPNEALPGDVVLIHRNGTSTHFGILTDQGVIHADAMNKKVIEHPILCSKDGWQIAAVFRPHSLLEVCS